MEPKCIWIMMHDSSWNHVLYFLSYHLSCMAFFFWLMNCWFMIHTEWFRFMINYDCQFQLLIQMIYVLCHMFYVICFMSHVLRYDMVQHDKVWYDMIWYDSNDTMTSDFLIHRITHKSWHQSVKQNQGSQRFLGIHFPDKFRASNETILEPQTRQFWGLRRDNFGKLY